MPTYVTLIRLTQQGIENIRDAGGGEDGVRQAIQGMGGELKSRYYTMGQCGWSSRGPTTATASRPTAKARCPR